MNTDVQKPQEVAVIAVGLICPSPFQGRKTFNEDTLNELADSIKEKGVLQPITLRKIDNEDTPFELVMGERRLRAGKLAGLTEISALIRELSDEEAREIVLIENVQREGLSPMEEARSVKELVDANGDNKAEAARKIGKRDAYVHTALALLTLPSDVQNMLDAEIINVAAARVILDIEGEENQLQAAKLAEKLNLTATQLRARMQKHIKTGGETKSKASGEPSGERKEVTFKELSKRLVAVYEGLEGFNFEDLDGSNAGLKNRDMLKRQTALVRQSLAHAETALLRDPPPVKETAGKKTPPKLGAKEVA